MFTYRHSNEAENVWNFIRNSGKRAGHYSNRMHSNEQIRRDEPYLSAQSGPRLYDEKRLREPARVNLSSLPRPRLGKEESGLTGEMEAHSIVLERLRAECAGILGWTAPLMR